MLCNILTLNHMSQSTLCNANIVLSSCCLTITLFFTALWNLLFSMCKGNTLLIQVSRTYESSFYALLSKCVVKQFSTYEVIALMTILEKVTAGMQLKS